MTETLCPSCRIVGSVSSIEDKKTEGLSFELAPRPTFEPGITLNILKAEETAPGEGLRARKRNAWKRRQEEAAKGKDSEEGKEPESKKPK